MKTGDLVWAQHGPAIWGLCVLLENKGQMFWDILWNEQIIMMHEDHMEVMNG